MAPRVVFDGRVQQPLVRLSRERRERNSEKQENCNEEMHLHVAAVASYCLTQLIRSADSRSEVIGAVQEVNRKEKTKSWSSALRLPCLTARGFPRVSATLPLPAFKRHS